MSHLTLIGVPDLATARPSDVSMLQRRTHTASAGVGSRLPSCWDKGAKDVSCRITTWQQSEACLLYVSSMAFVQRNNGPCRQTKQWPRNYDLRSNELGAPGLETRVRVFDLGSCRRGHEWSDWSNWLFQNLFKNSRHDSSLPCRVAHTPNFSTAMAPAVTGERRCSTTFIIRDKQQHCCPRVHELVCAR
jgi:hypothetical protein